MSSPAKAIACPQLKNILLGTDFSQSSAAALRFVRTIAQRCGSSIHVVHVLASEPARPRLDKDIVHQSAKSAMTRFLASHSLDGIPYHASIERGSAAGILSALIQYEDIDLIALGTYGKEPKGLALGSIAEQMLRRASCPVLTVGPAVEPDKSADGKLQRILYAANFSAGSMHALPYALLLAATNNSRLMLLHVDNSEKTSDWLQEAACEQRLIRLLPSAAANFCRIEPVIEIGPVCEKILEVATQKDANVIVMGAPAGARLSTVSAVVARARCPVLSVPS